MSGPAKLGGIPSFNPAAMTNLQKDLASACEQANRAWLERMKSEVELWTQLGTKLMATRTAPEAMQIYQECLTQRMRMAAEDGQKMSEDYQKFAQKIAHSFSNGKVGESS